MSLENIRPRAPSIWLTLLWTYLVDAAALITNLWFTHGVFENGDEYTRYRMRDATFRASRAGLCSSPTRERLGLKAAVTA